MRTVSDRVQRGARWSQLGILVNAVLALVKFLAGILGNSYALVADAVESMADIFGSLVVWGGLRLSAREPDARYHYGYGKAETIAAAVVGLTLVGAACGIAIEAVREIHTPRHAPAGYTLVVLLAVVVVKALLSRQVLRVSREVESAAVRADAWHHRSDAITSGAAAVGISVALAGGTEWAAADNWAALFASALILFNAMRILRFALGDLMDRAPDAAALATVRRAALGVPRVCEIEKLKIRRAGLGLFVDIHVEADPAITLLEAHAVAHEVKSAIQSALPIVVDALVHMEPHGGGGAEARAVPSTESGQPGPHPEVSMSSHPTQFQGSVTEALREAIEREIPDSRAEVAGGDGHFTIQVTSKAFVGKGMLASQRLVYSAIAHLMEGDMPPVHAIDNLKTRTP